MSQPSRSDPPRLAIIEEVGAELHRLFRAAEERPTHRGWRCRRFPAWRWRPLALIAVVTLGGASGALAAAGVFSGPTGTVPASPRPSGVAISIAGSTYRIAILPDVHGGAVGWCDQVQFVYPPSFRSGSAVQGCETPTINGPLIDAGSEGGNPGGRPRTNRRGRPIPPLFSPYLTDHLVVWFLTVPQVASMRISRAITYTTHTSRGLPYGYRLAVGFPLHQEGTGKRRQSLRAGGLRTPTLLDRAGHALNADSPSYHEVTLRDHATFWQHPATPPPGPCAINTASIPGARPQFGSVVAHIHAFPQVIGRLYLSCADTQLFYGHGYLMDTAILLDAHHPGSRPAPLPNATPVPGHPGVVNEAGLNFGSITGRRVGDAWLVVEATSPLALRLAILDQLGTCVRLAGSLCR